MWWITETGYVRANFVISSALPSPMNVVDAVVDQWLDEFAAPLLHHLLGERVLDEDPVDAVCRIIEGENVWPHRDFDRSFEDPVREALGVLQHLSAFFVTKDRKPRSVPRGKQRTALSHEINEDVTLVDGRLRHELAIDAVWVCELLAHFDLVLCEQIEALRDYIGIRAHSFPSKRRNRDDAGVSPLREGGRFPETCVPPRRRAQRASPPKLYTQSIHQPVPKGVSGAGRIDGDAG